MAWLKRKINWEYRAFSAWYITDTAYRQCTTRIYHFHSFSFSPMDERLYTWKGNVRERQWGLDYNAWQIDCLNRIGFNELHRRVSRGQKGTTNGKNVRALRVRNNTAHPKEGMFHPLFCSDQSISTLRWVILYIVLRVCTLCALWKYRRWTIQTVYSVRYHVG